VDFGDAVKSSVIVSRAVAVARSDKRLSVFLTPNPTAAGSLCSRFPQSWTPWFIDCVYVFPLTFRTSSDKDQ